MIQIGIQSEMLKTIIDGQKTVEGRLGKQKFLELKVGDDVSLREDIYIAGEITHSIENRVKIKIDAVTRFKSFEQMLNQLGYKNAIPSAQNIDDAIDKYRAYYSENDENAYGVIGLNFHIISS